MKSAIVFSVPAKPTGTIEIELFTTSGTMSDGYGVIERTTNGEAVGDHAGVWWDQNNTLTDYDGVAVLTKGMVQMLRNAGITVGDQFIF